MEENQDYGAITLLPGSTGRQRPEGPWRTATMNRADVYRRAAEIIVRDGKTERHLVEGERGQALTRIKDPAYRVCALGACARAEWELYGTLPRSENGALDPYTAYEFSILREEKDGQSTFRHIWEINDACGVSAEDIALLLKQHAEEADPRSHEEGTPFPFERSGRKGGAPCGGGARAPGFPGPQGAAHHLQQRCTAPL
ncbi:hypothetical protein [Streptomyces sp. NPDC096030]|uniref:DUF6197 family protein n=1 Tax=Streptomyces sp. NPDC096030 TaxID=3155423 RepID=UPI003328505C